PDPATHEQFLRRALALARAGLGLASPNPHVGAVIVDARGNIAGEGTYTYAGVKHAEVLSLEQAGAKANGGTLYINLEPHSHQGRTPPCTDALIAAGIRRVVACMPDPNPKVSGKGFEKLRAAGVQVEVGGFEQEARRLNEAFARYIRHGVPLVTLKAAMTLDGKIAPPPGVAKGEAGIPAGGWITGENARAHVHEQRHQSDAILVGIGTVLADDPILTDRSGHPRRRPLLRVILDSHLRLPLESRLVRSVNEDGVCRNDLMVFCTDGSGDGKEEKKKELEALGIRVEQLPFSLDHRPDIHAALRRLGEREITSVMIEGGATVNGMALSSGVVDKVFLYYAPKIMGRANSVPFVSSAAFQPVEKLPEVKHLHLHQFGEDFAVEGYLRGPYEN
ncbi:MAG: bifunctional diaminohydroxyphosphoribosylaminopyrimidine deaminase/5-amino-6-(5-phosphoribosylamino)uracil reductase RibD, partial [Candidatus Sulfotelmatobacter sp.]